MGPPGPDGQPSRETDVGQSPKGWTWYRKKVHTCAKQINDPVDLPDNRRVSHNDGGPGWLVKTSHGWVQADWGDFLATRDGEFYPISLDTMARTYEPVEDN